MFRTYPPQYRYEDDKSTIARCGMMTDKLVVARGVSIMSVMTSAVSTPEETSSRVILLFLRNWGTSSYILLATYIPHLLNTISK